jgi:hypothetical protein
MNNTNLEPSPVKFSTSQYRLRATSRIRPFGPVQSRSLVAQRQVLYTFPSAYAGGDSHVLCQCSIELAGEQSRCHSVVRRGVEPRSPGDNQGTLCRPGRSPRRRHHLSRPEEFTRFYDKLRAEFSKFSIRPIVSLAEGDLACVHWTVECVHTASGTPVRLTGTSVVRISNGQFVEAWQNWDAAGLAAQLPSESPQTGNPI